MSIRLVYPVPAQYVAAVSQTYAEHVARNLPNYNGGIDWAIPTHTRVTAAARGTVTRCGEDGSGYGTHVRVQHDDGTMTIYAHLASYTVKVGQALEAGDLIGLSDSTGNSTGPHLHFELRKNGKAIDPAPLFAALEPEPAARPRILPGWNLRSAPGMDSKALALTWGAGPVDVLERDGDWVAVKVWVHRDGVDGEP